MRKIPTLFQRDWNGDRSRVLNVVNPECQWVIDGEGVATIKWDGTAVLVKDGALYRRHDAKRGKTPPPGFVPAQTEPDQITGHFPGWLPVGDGPQDKWYAAAYVACANGLPDGTYELCGPHFQGNPEGLADDLFLPHGFATLDDAPCDYDGLCSYLELLIHEGIVWHHADGRRAKIKRVDYGLPWPVSYVSRLMR